MRHFAVERNTSSGVGPRITHQTIAKLAATASAGLWEMSGPFGRTDAATLSRCKTTWGHRGQLGEVVANHSGGPRPAARVVASPLWRAAVGRSRWFETTLEGRRRPIAVV